jgi:hypothetical protein
MLLLIKVFLVINLLKDKCAIYGVYLNVGYLFMCHNLGFAKNPKGSNVYRKARVTDVTPLGVILTVLLLRYKHGIPLESKRGLQRQKVSGALKCVYHKISKNAFAADPIMYRPG